VKAEDPSRSWRRVLAEPAMSPSRIALALIGLTLAGCATSEFAYRRHSTPRISVVHRPLHPAAGERIEFTAETEGAGVAEVRIAAFVPGPGLLEQVCAGAGPCVLAVAAGGAEVGAGFYGATLTTAGGVRAGTGSSYLFTVGEPPGATTYPLRVAIDFYQGLAQRRFYVLLVRDQDSYGGDAALLADATALLYDGLLADPAYRWRDNQLGFYYTRTAGRTRDYDSGVASRCGQAPWRGLPIEAAAEAEAAFADAVAVVHHRAGDRDCAGLGVVLAGAGTSRRFAAYGGDPRRFHHEFGHAFAGLADEYWESTASRTTGSTEPNPGFPACACCDEGGGEVGQGGPVVCQPGQPSCFATLPVGCPRADPACPPIASACSQPNVFASRAACEAAAAAAAAHPGVELAADPADCRLLCGPDGDPCPCVDAAAAVWILDRRVPVVAGAEPDDDLMGFFDDEAPAEWVGPACERCTETTFCRFWELGRGRTPAEANVQCLEP
jgi:hypothetical protein